MAKLADGNDRDGQWVHYLSSHEGAVRRVFIASVLKCIKGPAKVGESYEF